MHSRDEKQTTKLSSKLIIVFSALIFLLSLMTYLPSVTNGIWGDDMLWIENVWSDGAGFLSKTFAASDADSYWAIQTELKNRFKPSDGKLDIYLPPLPELLIATQVFVFDSSGVGFHLVNIFLNGVISILIFLLVLRLTKNKYQAFLAGLIYAIHPALALSTSMIGSQPYQLSAIFMLLAWLQMSQTIKNNASTNYLALLFFLFALFSDSLALTILLPLYLMLRSQNKLAIKSENIKSASIKPFLITAFCFLLIRAFLPLFSGSHTMEGYYYDDFIAASIKPFAHILGDLFSFIAVIPAMGLVMIPTLGIFAGFFSMLFILFAIYRSIKTKSLLARLGLSGFFVSELLIYFKPLSIIDSHIPAIFLTLIIIDFFSWLIFESKGSMLKKALAAIMLIYFVPAALIANQANQEIPASYSKTSARLANQLIVKLGDLGKHTNVYLFNVWGNNPFFAKEVKYKLGRKNIKIKTLMMDVSLVPYGLPVSKSWVTAWLSEQPKLKLNDTQLIFKSPNKHRLTVKTAKGAFMQSQADIRSDGEYLDIKPSVTYNLKELKVTPSALNMGYIKEVSFDFIHKLDAEHAVFAMWSEGRWKIFDPLKMENIDLD